MSWEWSHTPEAYDNARANLFNDFDEEKYKVAYGEAQYMGHEDLFDNRLGVHGGVPHLR